VPDIISCKIDMERVLKDIEQALSEKANAEKAAFLPLFFKTGKGQYGEGDRFLGVAVPEQRAIAKAWYSKVSPGQAEELLQSEWHECRLTALFILVHHYEKAASDQIRQHLVEIYLRNTHMVNNWDLVDSSAYQILGRHLWGKDRTLLDSLARTDDLWKQRISIIATMYFIRKGEVEDTIRIAEMLLHHKHDLIHKAVGWMLREAAKKEMKAVREFLDKHHRDMPRTMLRYAIERFDEQNRQAYLKGRLPK
jgi:3-methyladenine DNA glycosylase AlkD